MATSLLEEGPTQNSEKSVLALPFSLLLLGNLRVQQWIPAVSGEKSAVTTTPALPARLRMRLPAKW